MILSQPIARFRNVVLRPHGMQFVIDELHLVSVCVAGLVYGGMEAMPLCGMATAVSLFLLLVLAYRFIYLRLIRYRIVDFQEHQNLLQQLCGLKTVIIFSMDRNTPRLELTGIRRSDDIVPLIRERVEYNKRKKGIYEITNH